ncbi:PUR family DNA/RNA-binding protein [Patescibacteria group bacterium AH-259-L05]|nr:PUR family DNA/RNA-binding protein [Patescibacteria group bacterium AH-259-L05]
MAEENKNKPEPIYSQTLKTGSRTFFFDVRKAKTGDEYLTITESRIQKNGEKMRNTIFLFKDDFKEFCQNLVDIADKNVMPV